MSVLALDIGSSSVRAGVFDSAGELLVHTLVQQPIELTTKPGGLVEIDPRFLLKVTETVIWETLAAWGKDPIKAVGVSCFWHSLLALNADNKPLTPVIMWNDTRSQASVDALRAELDGNHVHQRTGCLLHVSYLPAKVHWLRESQPQIFRQAASVVSFAQYCTLVWTGSADVSVSMASGTGYFNHETGTWDEELLAATGITAEQLTDILPEPELLPSLLPRLRGRWPQLAAAIWRAPIGDGAASNVGSGCIKNDLVALMIGTSGAMRRCRPQATPDWLPAGLWRYRLDREYELVGGALSDGGGAYEWLQETLRLPEANELEAELAQRDAGQHGLIVLPFWSGERALGWVGDATATITGLRLHTTAVDIAQATLEAVAYRFAALYERIGDDRPRVIASGGGVNNSPAWTRVICDALDAPIAVSPVAEPSLHGAALVALRDTGQLNRLPVARRTPTYQPRKRQAERHRAARALQESLYQREVGTEGDNLLARQTRQ